MTSSAPTGWNLKEKSLTKTFSFNDFKEALAFVVETGKEAEKMNHHPDIDIRYNKVHLTLSSHDAGNKVTDKDHKLAETINQISPTSIIQHSKNLLN